MSCHCMFFFFFFFFFSDLGFTALSRIFHLYRADRSSKVGENRRTRRKTTWPSVSRTWLSHIWPERGSNHSGEKPKSLYVKVHKSSRWFNLIFTTLFVFSRRQIGVFFFFFFFFSYISHKTGFDISCKLSPLETFYEMSKPVFWRK